MFTADCDMIRATIGGARAGLVLVVHVVQLFVYDSPSNNDSTLRVLQALQLCIMLLSTADVLSLDMYAFTA